MCGVSSAQQRLRNNPIFPPKALTPEPSALHDATLLVEGLHGLEMV